MVGGWGLWWGVESQSRHDDPVACERLRCVCVGVCVSVCARVPPGGLILAEGCEMTIFDPA